MFARTRAASEPGCHRLNAVKMAPDKTFKAEMPKKRPGVLERNPGPGARVLSRIFHKNKKQRDIRSVIGGFNISSYYLG